MKLLLTIASVNMFEKEAEGSGFSHHIFAFKRRRWLWANVWNLKTSAKSLDRFTAWPYWILTAAAHSYRIQIKTHTSICNFRLIGTKIAWTQSRKSHDVAILRFVLPPAISIYSRNADKYCIVINRCQLLHTTWMLVGSFKGHVFKFAVNEPEFIGSFCAPVFTRIKIQPHSDIDL